VVGVGGYSQNFLQRTFDHLKCGGTIGHLEAELFNMAIGNILNHDAIAQ
jgi:hypothetical protein